MANFTWRNELKYSINTIEELQSIFNFPSDKLNKIKNIVKHHPYAITQYYLSLINKDDPNDPIRRIAIPSVEELSTEGVYDTSGEQKSTKIPGLQHKYQQTALLLLTNQCAVYCRFCFRKRLVGVTTKEILQDFDQAAEYITAHPEINNVLITGGDPLVLSNDILEKLLGKLSRIPHLKFIRIGTRIPVVFPRRISEDPYLQSLLKKYSTPYRRLFIVTQFDHPREITEQSIKAVQTLIRTGCIINNQTTLLKGVNDKPAVLAELQNSLTGIGVNPYYVFQCRPVKRVKDRFQLPLKRGIQVVEGAKKLLNGHSKRFKYAMSHETGKIEILGTYEGKYFFKYHQARNPRLLGKIFVKELDDTAGWLDTKPIPEHCL